MDSERRALLMIGARQAQQAFWAEHREQPLIALHPDVRRELAKWLEEQRGEPADGPDAMWGMRVVEDPALPYAPGFEVRPDPPTLPTPPGEEEVSRVLLMQDEPPAGVEMTVTMRGLWRALRGFGTTEINTSEMDAFEALWAQIAAERPDARG